MLFAIHMHPISKDAFIDPETGIRTRIANKVLAIEVLLLILVNKCVSYRKICTFFQPRGFEEVDISACVDALSDMMIIEGNYSEFAFSYSLSLSKECVLQMIHEVTNEDLVRYNIS